MFGTEGSFLRLVIIVFIFIVILRYLYGFYIDLNRILFHFDRIFLKGIGSVDRAIVGNVEQAISKRIRSILRMKVFSLAVNASSNVCYIPFKLDLYIAIPLISVSIYLIDHIGCLNTRQLAKIEDDPPKNWFCGKTCKKVFPRCVSVNFFFKTDSQLRIYICWIYHLAIFDCQLMDEDYNKVFVAQEFSAAQINCSRIGCHKTCSIS